MKQAKISVRRLDNGLGSMKEEPQFVICIRNDDYRASLELRTLYQVIPDASAVGHHQLRVIDESGEDYLYPESYFVALELPKRASHAVLRASELAS